MENGQTSIIESSAAPEIQHDVPTPTPPPKNHKKLLWILGIALILAIATAITFAVLYFTKPIPEQSSNEAPTSEEEPPVSTDSEEVEITDTYVIRDLDEKMSILHNVTETNSLIKKPGNGITYIRSLYKDGNLSEIAKLVHLANSLTSDYFIGSDAMQSIISEQGYEGSITEAFRDYGTEAIKGETMAAKYLDTYGENLNKGAANGQFYCPGIFYNTAYDFYYNPVLGCGGTGPYTVLVYKNKYTADAEHAYVYVNVGTFNAEDDKVYCDIIDYETSELPKVCGGPMEYSEFDINENNYQDFTQYRFVFNKADNGTYYFVKVEKL